jgi:hypothetical protein
MQGNTYKVAQANTLIIKVNISGSGRVLRRFSLRHVQGNECAEKCGHLASAGAEVYARWPLQ